MTSHLKTNVCIVGGGPAGCAAALRLAQDGVPSVLLEKSKFPRDKVCGDALSGKVVAALKRLDLSIPASAIQTDALPSWGVMFGAPCGETLEIPFKSNFDKSTDPVPGYVSKRLDFDHFLWKECRSNPLIDCHENTMVQGIIKSPEKLIITDQNEKLSVSAELVIGADGPHSIVSKELSGYRLKLKDQAYGIRAYYKDVQDLHPDQFIELHFLKEILPGYFWIFPMSNGLVNVGLGIRADLAKKRKFDLRKKLEQIVLEHPVISKRFKQATLIDRPKLHPLPLGFSDRPIDGDRFLLCGDAASLVDPFTGEGIGNAMFSGLLAAETYLKAKETNDFSASNLAPYKNAIHRRFKTELRTSKNLQFLAGFPWLFDLVVKRANRNEATREIFSAMFEDIDLRARLKQPGFYLNLLLH